MLSNKDVVSSPSAAADDSEAGEPRERIAEVPETSEPRSTAIARDAGKYRILAELGRGGMANVYLAVARGPGGFNKLVVLKCLRSDLGTDAEFLSMFLDEARLAARLNHPHVVQTYEVGEYLGRPVIVMEYLEGQMLSNLVQKAEPTNALPLALHLRIIIDALEGLHHAHELTDYDGTPLGLVHRDISPQNVFVTFDGQVKVLDFGIAKAVTSQSQTDTGILKGKIKYMAPEQMLNAPVDRRADIFSVGVLIWEAATGQRMWKGMTDVQVMNKVIHEGGQSLREVSANVPPDLEAIIVKALGREPSERYGTALELATALEGWIEPMGTGASSRNLGKLMRQLFEDARRRTRVTVETQLRDVKTAPYDPHALPPNLVRLSMRPGRDGSGPLATVSNALTRSAETPAPTPTRRKLAVLLLASLALAAGVVVFVLRHEARTVQANAALAPVSAQPLAPPASAAPSASAPVVPAQVSLHIASTAPRATLFLDGHRLAGNPYAGSLANDGAVHEVRVEAVGFASRTIDVLSDRDIHLAVTLDALPRGAAQPARMAASSPHPAASANASNAVTNDKKCSPPFYIDAEGIKKFKPECL